MKIRIGYDLGFSSSMTTPSILMLSVHPSRLDDLSEPHQIGFDPPTPSRTYNDHFGNICTRIVMSPGVLRAMIETCALACRICAEECEKHAGRHEHCRVCAAECRRCEQACTAAIARVSPSGGVTVAASGLWFPNGMVITPDGRTMIVAESAARQ